MLFLKNKKFKFFLVAIIAITLGVIAAMLIGYRHILNQEVDLLAVAAIKSNIAMGKVHHTATRDGIKEWMIDARTVRVISAQNQAVFQDPAITFFLKDNTKVYLTANRGILSTDSNDIEVSGNVVVKNEKYRLKTEILNYKHSKRILFSKVSVEIVSASSQLTADSMTHDLNLNETLFKGHIKGVFVENIIL